MYYYTVYRIAIWGCSYPGMCGSCYLDYDILGKGTVFTLLKNVVTNMYQKTIYTRTHKAYV